MAIFDFLKKFSKKEVKEVKFNELEPWLDSLMKDTEEEMNLKLVPFREKIDSEKKRMKENIQKLKEAELKNPNIPERAKQIMEGNRTVYLQKVNTLLDEISLPKNFGEILEFCSLFDNALDDFSKATTRSYHILQEFFIEETTNISANIRNLDYLIVKKVKKLIEDSGIEKMRELKNKVNQTKQKIKLKQELKEKIKQLQQKLEKENKKIKTKENKIKEIEEGSEYKRFTELVNKRKIQAQKIEELEKQYLNSFSDIKTALKKYERLTLDDKLVRKYFDNPLKALLEDNEFKIIELLVKIKVSIIKGTLKLKEKKKSRILRELDKLDKTYFETYLSRYNELTEQLAELKLEIDKTEIIKELKGIKEELIKNNLRMEEDKNKFEKMMEELESINIENLNKNTEKEILEKINEEVKLIY